MKSRAAIDMIAGKCLLVLVVGLLAPWCLASEEQCLPCQRNVHADVRIEEYKMRLGPAGNQESEFLVLEEQIGHDTGAWSRLHISDFYLGSNSLVEITSGRDGQVMRMNRRSIEAWHNFTPIFQGTLVSVRLVIAPGDTGVFVAIDRMMAGYQADAESLEEAGYAEKTLCDGTDERVPATSDRIARIWHSTGSNCTAYIIANGALLTAGHCVDFDPDELGPLLPDGIINTGFLNAVIEFDVPLSSADGVLAPASLDDQYPVDPAYIQFGFIGDGLSYGRDWAVFKCGPNGNVGGPNEYLLPAIAQDDFFRMVPLVPDDNDIIRITGCGADSIPYGATIVWNQFNSTLQTDTGLAAGSFTDGFAHALEYRVDTEGGNSGSPIVRHTENLSMGIHTNSGCGTGGANLGTSFLHFPLANAIDDYYGSNTTYVDKNSVTASETGNVFFPYQTVSGGNIAVSENGVLCIVKGFYNESITFNKAMTIIAPVGTVKIGSGPK